MILDSSAILCVLLREPGFEEIVTCIADAETLSIGAPTLAETGIILGNRLGDSARSILIHFLHEWRVNVIPFGERHWQEAVEAYSRFGRGRHKAALNFGDCMTFAVARLARQPLLCTGRDFARTDLLLAW
jgi:ribonuclease VapC